MTCFNIHAIIEKSDGGDRMDKMLETIKLLAMLCVVLFFYYLFGCINYYSPFYQPAEAAAPSSVTINGRSASLLSGSDNLECAFAIDYGKQVGCHINGTGKLVDVTHGGIGGFYKGADYYTEYKIDPFGSYPGECLIYNGVTNASTTEELEAAFGEDCLKAENYYAEIFLDDVEVDYEKINFPADRYGGDFSWDDWWEDIKAKYPETKYCTVLLCYYYNDTQNDISFMVFENEQLTQKE